MSSLSSAGAAALAKATSRKELGPIEKSEHELAILAKLRKERDKAKAKQLQKKEAILSTYVTFSLVGACAGGGIHARRAHVE